MFVFSRLSIQSKMILLLLVVSLSSIAVMAWIGYATARTSLTQAVENQLEGVRVAKTTTLKMMIASIRERVMLVAERQTTIDAMRDFQQAYRELGKATLTASESQKLDDFYRNEFIPSLDRSVEGEPVLEQYLPTRAAERYLQYHYIAANPRPYGHKEAMADSPTDTTSYGNGSRPAPSAICSIRPDVRIRRRALGGRWERMTSFTATRRPPNSVPTWRPAPTPTRRWEPRCAPSWTQGIATTSGSRASSPTGQTSGIQKASS